MADQDWDAVYCAIAARYSQPCRGKKRKASGNPFHDDSSEDDGSSADTSLYTDSDEEDTDSEEATDSDEDDMKQILEDFDSLPSPAQTVAIKMTRSISAKVKTSSQFIKKNRSSIGRMENLFELVPDEIPGVNYGLWTAKEEEQLQEDDKYVLYLQDSTLSE